MVPVEIAGLKLARRGMAAIGNAHCTAHAEAAFGEVQTVAHRATDAIVGDPLDEFGVNAALQNKILDQASDVIHGNRGAHRLFDAEAAAHAARHVVFAAAFPRFEFARGADAAFAGVE